MSGTHTETFEDECGKEECLGLGVPHNVETAKVTRPCFSVDKKLFLALPDFKL